MEVKISQTYDELSQQAAEYVAEFLNAKPNAVLGLATGSSPVGLYKELVRMHTDEGLDFSQVTTFNLDEYVGLPARHEQSYHYFMHENLFKHINVPKERIHEFTDGCLSIDALARLMNVLAKTERWDVVDDYLMTARETYRSGARQALSRVVLRQGEANVPPKTYELAIATDPIISVRSLANYELAATL